MPDQILETKNDKTQFSGQNLTFQGTSDLRDLTQYKYARQTVLPKHFNVTSTLTSFLTN